jgi:hypothetical protein
MPSIAEMLMLPYLVATKYFLKSGGKSEIQPAEPSKQTNLPARESVD